jgi:hydrogenase maturation protease
MQKHVFQGLIFGGFVKVIILGIGNILLRDDGVGVHAVNKLRNDYDFPEYVQIIDGGTKGLDLLPFIEESDRVLIIDAANFKKEPGTIGTIEGDKIPSFLSTKLSVHQIGLPDMLFAAKLMEIIPPEMCLVGIQPKSMETGTELSKEVEAKLDLLIDRALEKLREWKIQAIQKKAHTC